MLANFCLSICQRTKREWEGVRKHLFTHCCVAFGQETSRSGAIKCDLAQETFYSIECQIVKLFIKILNIFIMYLSLDFGFKFKLKLYLLLLVL